MRSSLVSRRVLGLAAAGVLSLSTLAVPGIALAEEPAGAGAPSVVSPVPDLDALPDTTAPDTTTPAADEPDVAAAVVAAPTGGQFHASGSYISIVVDGAFSDEFEYSLDNGATWTYIDGYSIYGDDTKAAADIDAVPTPNGIQVRNIDGQDRSAGVALTEIVGVGAPTNVTAAAASSAITADWDAPAPNGSTYAIGGYEVYVSQVGGEGGGGGVCNIETPDVTACTFLVPDGFEYDVTVIAYDAEGYDGGQASVRSAKVPTFATPTTVPTQDDGDLMGPAGPITTLTAGQQIVLTGDKFLPGTSVRLTMFSAPVDLGTAVVASDSTFSATVTVPKNLANGTHTLVATGLSEDGNVRNLVITVTVSGGEVTAATLATTGFDAVPVAAGGALVLLVGGGLLVGARRRTTV